MIKYTSIEKMKVLSPESHKKIASGLSKLAKRRVEDLDESDKEQILKEVSEDDRFSGD